MITPPVSISARPRLTRNVPVSGGGVAAAEGASGMARWYWRVCKIPKPVGGSGRRCSGSAFSAGATATFERVYVLGIDPGLSRCGYGLVERAPAGLRAVAVGVLRTDPRRSTANRLAELQRDLRDLLREHRPEVVAVERVLFQVNARTAIPVAQAAGLALAESVAAGAEVVEYSPNQVKQAVAGAGAASKEQMERMVQTLLHVDQPLRPVDAADAVAVALCHLAHAPLRSRVALAMGEPRR